MTRTDQEDRKAPPPPGPLAGCRVLELSNTVAGPFCGRLLGDFGAEVVKVEPAEGDPVRWMGRRHAGKSLYAASILRNKRLIVLDLRKPEGQEIARRLAARSDVLVENFRPGTLEKWGLGYDRLAALNPGLVMVRISGYGQDGPYSMRPGYGVTSEAFSGLREVTGDPDRPPARVAVSLTDYVAGLYGAFGAVVALYHRHRTGQGQVVDTALYEAAFSFMEPHVPAYGTLGVIARRAGSRLPNHTPNNLYPTGDGGYIHIAAGSQPIFGRLAMAMGMPELLADPRFATPEARSHHEDEIDAVIAEWTGRRRLDEVERLLLEAEVPAARIYTMADIFADRHYRARQMLVDVVDDEIGPITLPGIVPKLSATPGAIRWGGRRTGEDTREVLRRLADLTDEEVDWLQAAGVVYCAESGAETRRPDRDGLHAQGGGGGDRRRTERREP